MGQALHTVREDHLVAWLTALAISIHVVESVLPSPVPGIKPGLANAITVSTLILFGWRLAAWVGLLRVLVGSLIIGTFMSPTFMLSLSGAVASLAMLGLASRLPGEGFGPVGYCILAAMAHMGGQFVVAYWFFIPHEALFGLLPPLMTAAVGFGIVTGVVTHAAIDPIKQVRT
jgi:heptaprenyl diphosphate synthase